MISLTCSSSSESCEEENVLFARYYESLFRRKRIYRPRSKYMDIFDDKDFTCRFRLKKSSVIDLYGRIGEKINPNSSR